MVSSSAYAAFTGLFVGALSQALLQNSTKSKSLPLSKKKRKASLHSREKQAFLIAFYMNVYPTDEGDYIDDILQWPTESPSWENKHKFIQWLFPTNTQSHYNSDAPTLDPKTAKILKHNPEFKHKYIRAFERFMAFMRVKLSLNSKNDKLLIEIEDSIQNKPPHNFQRLTRVLRSLRCFGFDDVASLLYNALVSKSFDSGSEYEKSKVYWANVVKADDIWSPVDFISDISADQVELSHNSSLLYKQLKIHLKSEISHGELSPVRPKKLNFDSVDESGSKPESHNRESGPTSPSPNQRQTSWLSPSSWGWRT